MKTLKDIAEIQTGYNSRSTADSERQEVILVSAKDLNVDFVGLSTARIPASYHNYLQRGDILVKSRGLTYEAKVFRTKETNLPHIATNTLIVVRIKDRSYKPTYIAQIINSEGSQQFLRSLSLGQTVPSLSPASLGSLNCPKISLEKQNQLEVVTEIIDEYRITLVKYVKTGEKLTKALKNELAKGVK